MSKIIMSTDYCYEGYDSQDESWTIGDYEELTSSEYIDKESINFSHNAWQDEKDYLVNFIEYEIDMYEKETSESVLALGMIGSVGVWTGNHRGGKVIDLNNLDKLLEMDVDTINVTVDEDREITIKGHHHDGTHRMSIYFITETILKKLKLFDDFDNYGVDELNTLVTITQLGDNLESLKLRKNSQYFGVQHN